MIEDKIQWVFYPEILCDSHTYIPSWDFLIHCIFPLWKIKKNTTFGGKKCLSFSFTHLWWSPRSLQLSVNIMVTWTSDAWSEQFNKTWNPIMNRAIRQNEIDLHYTTEIKLGIYLSELSNIMSCLIFFYCFLWEQSFILRKPHLGQRSRF